ncbi:glycosyltransferase family 43 [Ancylostoma ceylanicum]|uniref:Galactosylgalactosylxylosylprotein 3-beta-glucuronosyltransferase n=1 Tax=Ancylostoma ceylanicum TaxID=53326 RepID=A0A0D6LZ40_9BILA|nr:glycosyltransferase family 43 [Ancylostoma ceylanicum]
MAESDDFYAQNYRLRTLSHVPHLHWIVVEDGTATVPAVSWILHRCGVPHVYMATTTAEGMPRRGWTHRNLALQYVRENYDQNHNAVLYFADDDNSYDAWRIKEMKSMIDIPERTRTVEEKESRETLAIKRISDCLVGGAWVEAPHVASNGKVIAWDVMFAPSRPFATDMAGFAINIKELFRVRQCAKNYKQGPESCFLSQFGFKKEHLEPFGYKDYPKEILVWHTKTSKSRTRGPKRGYAIE